MAAKIPINLCLSTAFDIEMQLFLSKKYAENPVALNAYVPTEDCLHPWKLLPYCPQTAQYWMQNKITSAEKFLKFWASILFFSPIS